MNTANLGRYKEYNYCRFCKNKNIYSFLDLGNQPLAGAFLKEHEFKNEKFYPLKLVYCRECHLVQTSVVIDGNKLFRNYFYKTSAINTLLNHFKKNAILLSKMFKSPKNNIVLEIGCNDGNFLCEMKKKKFKVLGIDPATNIVKGIKNQNIKIINDFFSFKKAKEIESKYGKVNLIVSTNTLAHIEDMNDVFKGISYLLKENGILYFENHYLGSLIKEIQYDMIYHEHLYYYSLLSISNFLKKHNLEVFNIRQIPIHGGSIGFFVQKINGPYKISKRVKNLTLKETKEGFNKDKTYSSFSKKVNSQKNDLLKTLLSLKKKNKTIAAYGASGRGTVVSNYVRLDNKIIDYVIDDSKIKQGYFTPGVHLKIISSNLNNKNRPDYTLLYAWSFYKEIKARNKKYEKAGGKFILPLPKVKII